MTDRDPQLSQLLDRLNPAFDVEPDWDDAIARAQYDPPGRSRRRHRTMPILALGATIAVTVTVLILSPWRSSPSIVDLASAALTPKPGTIVYEYIEETSTNLRTGVAQHGRRQLWLAPDGQFRSVQRVPGQPIREQGRLGKGLPLLTYLPATNVMNATCGSDLPAPVDPVQVIRNDLSKGTLRARGRAEVNHRAAELLVHTSPGETDYLYVDPSTYSPIELRSQRSTPAGRTLGVIKFLAYRYLPPTPTNLKLTNIRAENPHARHADITNYDTPC